MLFNVASYYSQITWRAFRKRYAFHLHNWLLDNQGITSHQKCLQEKQSMPLRVVLQAAGSSDKVYPKIWYCRTALKIQDFGAYIKMYTIIYLKSSTFLVKFGIYICASVNILQEFHFRNWKPIDFSWNLANIWIFILCFDIWIEICTK